MESWNTIFLLGSLYVIFMEGNYNDHMGVSPNKLLYFRKLTCPLKIDGWKMYFLLK